MEEKTIEELTKEIEDLISQRDQAKAEKDESEKALRDEITNLTAERDKYKAERDEANDNLLSMRNIDAQPKNDEFDELFGGMKQ